MDPKTKQSAYGTSAHNAAGSAMMGFQLINAIHQHLCAFHTYSEDQSRQVEAHHFCNHLSPEFHQCVIYDSQQSNARLIGIEYIVSERMFSALPANERVYWHSHKYEVESGLFQIHPKNMVPGQVTDLAEQPAMLELQKTYGKTIHTWAFDVSPDLPLGPPSLMMSFTADGQVNEDLVRSRDERTGQSTEHKQNIRLGYLPADYQKAEGADEWEKTGKTITFEAIQRSAK